MGIKSLISKFRFIPFFNIFSFLFVSLISFCLVLAVLCYFEIIDRNSRIVMLANEILAGQIGLPIEEIKKLEERN